MRRNSMRIVIVQLWPTLDPRRLVWIYIVFQWNRYYSFENDRDKLSWFVKCIFTRCPRDSPEKCVDRLLFRPNCFRTVQSTAFNEHKSIMTEYFNYPTTHPVFIAPLQWILRTNLIEKSWKKQVFPQNDAVVHFGGGCLFHMLSSLDILYNILNYWSFYSNRGSAIRKLANSQINLCADRVFGKSHFF